MIASSRRSSNAVPWQARSSASICGSVSTATGCSGTSGGFMRSIGDAPISPSLTAQLPTAAILLDEYASFCELRAAAHALCETVNAREHRETHQPPMERLAAGRRRLHPMPVEAHTIAFGQTWPVDDDATLRFGSARYSVPHQPVP